MTAPNTLGLDDDLDSVELLMAIERAFDIKISDEDARDVTTVGDLHRIVAEKLQGVGGDKCRTSMAFYRVRRALKAVVGDIDVRPSADLRAIWRGSPKSLFEQAQRHCDLRLARLSSTYISGYGGLLIVAAIFGAPILLVAKVNGWLILALAVGLIAIGVTLTRLDPLSFGPTMATVGDLARRTATQNYGALSGLGGRSNDGAIWDALTEVSAVGSENLSAKQITPATIILQSQFEKSREVA